jgi:hypothetical protein
MGRNWFGFSTPYPSKSAVRAKASILVTGNQGNLVLSGFASLVVKDG